MSEKIIFIMKEFVLFISKGFNTLSTSSRGKYLERTDDINELRREMLYEGFGSFRTDKENLMKDRKSISGDIGRAFSGISNLAVK